MLPLGKYRNFRCKMLIWVGLVRYTSVVISWQVWGTATINFGAPLSIEFTPVIVIMLCQCQRGVAIRFSCLV